MQEPVAEERELYPDEHLDDQGLRLLREGVARPGRSSGESESVAATLWYFAEGSVQ